MPKYTDFMVGDTWMARNGQEVVIGSVHDNDVYDFPIESSDENGATYTANGFYMFGDDVQSEYDLIYKKGSIDLSKPMRFKEDYSGDQPFTIDNIENVPEPQKQRLVRWVVLNPKNGEVFGMFDTKKEADENGPVELTYDENGPVELTYIVVKLEGEYDG